MPTQFDKFDQLKPGLSSYADNPPAAAESLAPLLKLAEQTIPKEAWAGGAPLSSCTLLKARFPPQFLGILPATSAACCVPSGSQGRRRNIAPPGLVRGVMCRHYCQHGLVVYQNLPAESSGCIHRLCRRPRAAAGTSIMVGATAGLRLLPDGKADVILQEVRDWLRKHPFKASEMARGACHADGGLG